ncbi:hypothetical protein Zmor_003603 [Zophobas morio]|uniref:Kinesin-like protein n=1 Tax=Zophobas morio TaxID=2755281 RepID=A0AA38HMY3_9CUCU|nr:hypothetical protein Zmor_003603 [Zophobas morio]
MFYRDLLKIKNSKSLELREITGKGVCVTHLHSQTCQSADDMMRTMRQGNKNRTSGATNMNEHSSRSHVIFQIVIEMAEHQSKSVKVGKLNLVDLAGSERQSKTGATGESFKEATKINKALSSLGNVIYALAENSEHIPYRDSKLTRLLQDSLGGNSKTIMIANIGPANVNYDETIITLRYAYRAKSIKNQLIKPWSRLNTPKELEKEEEEIQSELQETTWPKITLHIVRFNDIISSIVLTMITGAIWAAWFLIIEKSNGHNHDLKRRLSR